MKLHDRQVEELAELLGCHALGLLEGEEAAEVQNHLREGCAECSSTFEALRNTAAQIGFDVARQQPPQGLRERILERVRTTPQAQVWKAWNMEASLPDLYVVRAGEGGWQAVAEGVFVKQLYVDTTRDAVTMLIRMEPGSSYSAHRHRGPEQCFVLQGDINDGYGTYYQGDFQCAATGSHHGIQSTEKGCLLLIVSSMRDELTE
jgi:predicted ChrR family anti-sigma factor